MKEKIKNVYYDSDNKRCVVERDSMNESVYGYILMDDYKALYDKPEKVKALHKIFPYSNSPNWVFKKGADNDGNGGTEYVGFEELTALTKDQETYAKDNKITFVGTSAQFNEWLQATTVMKMMVHKVKQGYRTVKAWVME